MFKTRLAHTGPGPEVAQTRPKCVSYLDLSKLEVKKRLVVLDRWAESKNSRLHPLKQAAINKAVKC